MAFKRDPQECRILLTHDVATITRYTYDRVRQGQLMPGVIEISADTGKLETVAILAGFTRGIDFCGRLAFIGLSQVRETAVFSGIPLIERLTERTCGI
ncbi:MAG: hypothetical protein N5P05_000731 [Chroococcopsis gigantea SAG 12.99]|jgi:hypothetical protein|nr:DUF4915 domain-containing protein [Chlorogloea purpurea SAG 13.99]MDV2999125.1 hypothetical protein [Chroococcopsis gigantea SAG 12.99]